MQIQQAEPFYIHSCGVPPAPSQQTVAYRNSEGIDQRITAAKFYELTQACYVTTSFPSRRFAKTIPAFKGAVAVSDKFLGATDEKLRLVHIDGENAFVGFGVVATRAISKGEFICRYNGRVVLGSERGGQYQLDDIDAGEFRGLGAMVNHSFPNSQFVAWQHGKVREWVVRALDDIAKGDSVCVDYGQNYESLTIGRHAELRFDAARAFVTSKYIHNDINGLELKNLHKWRYLATNPAVLLELYFTEALSWANLDEFMGVIPLFVELPANFEAIRNWLKDGLGRLDKAFSSLRETNLELYSKIHSYFRDSCRNRSCLGALYALKMFGYSTSSSTITRCIWQEAVESLDGYIDAWQHIFSVRIMEEESFITNSPFDRAMRTILDDSSLRGKILN